MEVVIVPDRSAGGAVAGGAIAALVSRQPDAVLGLATGSSPEPVYADVVARHHAGSLSFRQARAFLLDEYVGLPPDHPQSYRAVIEREVTSRLDFRSQSVRGPDGNAEDLLAACVTYDAQITAAGGVDLQLLGIGSDGHIGFNEPGSSLGSRTRLKTLTSRTRADKVIRQLDEFGESYFRLTEIARISPETYRRIAGRVHGGIIEIDGRKLALTHENTFQIRAAIQTLRSKLRPQPNPNTPRRTERRAAQQAASAHGSDHQIELAHVFD